MKFPKNPLKSKSFFKKTLFLFLTILITAVLATSVIISFAMRVPLERSLAKTQESVMLHVGQTTDNYILNQLDLIYKQYFIPSGRDKIIDDFFSKPINGGSISLMDMHKIYNYLFDLGVNYQFIDSIDIYSPAANTVISSKRGFSTVLSDTRNKMAIFNTNAANEFLASGKASAWVSETENHDALNGVGYTDTVSLYLTVTDSISYDVCGLVCFNIQSAVLKNYILGFLHLDGAELLIFNQDKLLLCSDKNRTNNYSDIYTLSSGDANGLISYKSNSIIWASSQQMPLKYVVITDSEKVYSDLIRTTQLTLFLTVIILLIAAIIIYYGSMQLYHPIKHMIEKIPSEITGHRDDELAFIDNVIQNLSYRVQDLESTIDDHKDAITNQVVYDIINGNISGVDEVKQRLELSGIEFNYPLYTLIFTEVDNNALKNMDYEQREYLFYTTIEKLRSTMDKIGLCLSIRHSNFIISVLALDDIKALDKITPGRLNLASCINLGICPTRGDITLLSQDFLMLNTYMQYSYIYGYGYIFKSDVIEKYEKTGSGFPDDILEEVKSLLSANKPGDIKDTFSEAIRLIRQNGFSCNYTHQILLQFISLIAQNYKASKKNDEATDYSIIDGFNKATNLDMLTDWLFDLLDNYSDMLKNHSTDVQQDFVNKIADYINENITENLSLSTVASAFGISSGYLSHIFKDALNVNFSAYLNEKKFEAAADMLTKYPDLSVTDIAQKIGYYNMSYFIQQFKKKYGMTPLQYRKLNIK